MTQIIIPTAWLKKAKERAEADPLYSHKVFANQTDVGRTIIEDYIKGLIISKEAIDLKNSELEDRVRNLVKDELEKKKC